MFKKNLSIFSSNSNFEEENKTKPLLYHSLKFLQVLMYSKVKVKQHWAWLVLDGRPEGEYTGAVM